MSELVLRASEWCYHGIWYGLTQWMKVPQDPPSLPTIEGESLVSFRPSIGYLNYLRFFFWVGLVIIDLFLIFCWIGIAMVSLVAGILITPIALALIVLPDIVAYIAIHLKYDTTWYVLSDRSMRIRRGIWKIHETTITFENIQNVHFSQGPLQRYFGFANLIVQTAGGGGIGPGQEAMAGSHVGVLEGLDRAQEVRDLIFRRLKSSKTAGLGDDRTVSRDCHSTEEEPFSSEDLNLLREIRDLTAQLSRGNG